MNHTREVEKDTKQLINHSVVMSDCPVKGDPSLRKLCFYQCVDFGLCAAVPRAGDGWPVTQQHQFLVGYFYFSNNAI